MAQSALARRVFIAGGAHTSFIGKGHPDFVWKGHPDFGKRENPTFEDDLKEAVEGCLDDTGADPAAIDRLYLGNFVGELFVKQGHMGAALVGSHPAFEGKLSDLAELLCGHTGWQEQELFQTVAETMSTERLAALGRQMQEHGEAFPLAVAA